MMVQYKPNEQDSSIIADITNTIRSSLGEWYGRKARLNSPVPEIRSYRNSFILRYPLALSQSQNKHLLVKIRRNPKMDSLTQAIQADIHQNMEREYNALKFVHDHFTPVNDNIDAIRPLLFMHRYLALVMEEYPSRSMRQLLKLHRSKNPDWAASELKDAARKTGRWLYFFHCQLYAPFTKPYTTSDILLEVQEYADRIEQSSQGRVQAQEILDAFSKKLENITVERMTFSQSHSDMTIDNVLYSDDKKVCVIDIKSQIAPEYTDLGLILTHPETSKPQIFSGGKYYSEELLSKYRAEIIGGYFDQEPGDEVLVRVYSALKVVDKWSMYEELMSRYKGIKHTLSIPVAPLVSKYFQNLLRKHLELIGTGQPRQSHKLDETPLESSL